MGKELNDIGGYKDRAYPVRCVRDDEYLFVMNFKPELWPVGNPETGFTGADSSPTKTLILDEYTKGKEEHFQLCFGKRPSEELFNIKDDPSCMNNLAYVESYTDIKSDLKNALLRKLIETKDPRILGEGDVYDTYNYVGPSNHSWKNYEEGTFEPQDY